MSNIYIEYLQGCFDKNDIAELNQISNNHQVALELHEKHPAIYNAALDELVPEILLFINSNGLQTSIDIFNIVNAAFAFILWMKKKVKSKKIAKVSTNSVEEKEPNIIIQVDNVHILLDKKATDEQLKPYLQNAIKLATRAVKEQENKSIIIDGDNNTVNVYNLEEFAKKKIGRDYKTIRSTSHRKYGRRK